MAINRLQIRRDSLADFQTASSAPLVGEPTLINEESRVRIATPNPTGIGRVQVSLPPTEGSQFFSIWNARSFGDGAAAVVPAFMAKNDAQQTTEKTPAVEPSLTAFSGPLPNGFGNDAGTVFIQASGDFLAGSTDPNMVFGFMIGDMEETNATFIGPDPGHHAVLTVGSLRPQLGGAGPFLTVGTGSGMPNVLGDYNKPVLWNLDAKMCVMGRSAISPFKSSMTPITVDDDPAVNPLDLASEVAAHSDRVMRAYDGSFNTVVSGDDDNANVRVFGTLTIMDPFVMTGANRSYVHAPGSLTSTASAEIHARGLNCDWGLFSAGASEYPTSLARGMFVSSNGIAYEALGLVPGENYSSIEAMPDSTVADLAAKVDRLSRAQRLSGMVSPGTGSRWYHWWRPTKTVVEFSFEEYVPNLQDDNLILKLKVGGPLQSDPNITYDAFSIANNTVYLAPQGMSYPRIGPYAQSYTAQGAGLFAGRVDQGTIGQKVCRVINGEEYVARVAHKRTTAARFATTTGDFVDRPESADANAIDVYYSDPAGGGNQDGEWNCYWRRLADDRCDKMRIHHSTAFAFGGRPGSTDFLPF
jgi:hypothetical protein